MQRGGVLLPQDAQLRGLRRRQTYRDFLSRCGRRVPHSARRIALLPGLRHARFGAAQFESRAGSGSAGLLEPSIDPGVKSALAGTPEGIA